MIIAGICFVWTVMTGSLQLTQNGLDLAVEGHDSLAVNFPEDILNNYKEAVICYSKVCDLLIA